MEEVEVPHHEHPLIPFTRFDFSPCRVCKRSFNDCNYIYGGFRCNQLGCEAVFHKECAKPLPEINHSSHPDHPLKLIILDSKPSTCSFCRKGFQVGYCCSICDFKLDLGCARRPLPLLILGKSNAHEHPLELFDDHLTGADKFTNSCNACGSSFVFHTDFYTCHQCKFFIHQECVDVAPEAEVCHASHPQHPLKSLKCEVPGYADKKCLLCGEEFDGFRRQLHHCDVCNVSICGWCMRNPPPLGVASPTTHEHQLHLVPRRVDFTCNTCGTLGDRSPYFCLECNFMIHRVCIDLPRIININRHGHRISYTRRLGHGNWKCGVCRQNVDGFYGAYSCFRGHEYVVHSRCATRIDVWDMIELENTPEEPEEPPPFEVIDDDTIKHFSHDHYLKINKDGMVPSESILCKACAFQICSEPWFYSCEQCDFIIHKKCANFPRKKRHVSHNQPFTLRTSSHHKDCFECELCRQMFTGFRYESRRRVLDVRCGSISDLLVHPSHPHPLYYSTDNSKRCSGCRLRGNFSCDECDFSLNYTCALLPQKITRHRYDDHPLYLSYGENSVDGIYWCEACETKLNPKRWFYTCNDCGIVLHIYCVLGELSYIMPGTEIKSGQEVVPNTSVCRPICSTCKTLCMLPSILKISAAGVVVYTCATEDYISVNELHQYGVENENSISKF